MATQGPEGMVEVELRSINKGRPAKIEIFRPRLLHLCGVVRKLTPPPHRRTSDFLISDGFL